MDRNDKSTGHRVSPPVRLPRLDVMDRSHQRERSTSSPGVYRGMAPPAHWSPSHGHGGSVALDRSQSSASSPTVSQDHWRYPRLPEPSRTSSMLSGSLPPLSALHGDTLGTQAESSRYSTSPNLQPLSGEVSPGPGPSRSYSHTEGIAPSSNPPRMAVSPPHHPPRPSPYDPYMRRTVVPTFTGLPAPSAASPVTAEMVQASRKAAKAHVSSACLNCKRAHLACDSERPCRRCAKLGKTATCVDVQHKKRGRPRLKDREIEEVSPSELALPTSSAWSAVEPPPPTMYFGVAGPSDHPPPLPETSSHVYTSHPRGAHIGARGSLSEMGSLGQRPSSAPRKLFVVTTLLCGLDLVTVHASQESQVLFGLLPSQVCGREVLDFVHPDDQRLFEETWARLVHPVDLAPHAFPAAGWEMMHRTTCHLLAPARGTIFVEDVIRIHTAGDGWTPCHLRLHLGGAFGLDLYRPETRDRAFVVCSLHPVDASSSSTHPGHHQLASAAFDPMGWSGTVFKTPMGSSPPALPPLSTAPRPSSNHSLSSVQGDTLSPAAPSWPAGGRGEVDDGGIHDVRPSKVARLPSYTGSTAASTPASAAPSIDSSLTKTATSPSLVSPVESIAPTSPPTASMSSSKGVASDRLLRYPFSTWPPQGSGPTVHNSAAPPRSMWQPTFSSARVSTAAKLSASQSSEGKAPVLSRSTSADERVARTTASIGSDMYGAVAT